METRRIGSLKVTIVGLGCNNFGMRLDYPRTEAVVHAVLDAGITLFDTADIYGGAESEQFLGRALAGRRQDVVVATKFGMRVDDGRQGAKPAYDASGRGQLASAPHRLDRLLPVAPARPHDPD